MDNIKEASHHTGGPPHLNDHDVIDALRAAHRHQSQLLILADQKANILVGILAVILTIIFTKADNLLEISDTYLIPLACFVAMEVTALVLALLVIMPKTIGRPHADSMENIPNPLFFGFFTAFSENEYLDYLSTRLNDNSSARRFLAKDLYQGGSVLRKKYVLLKYTYLLAVAGVALLAFSSVLFLFIR